MNNTILKITNSILRRLREPTVSNVTDNDHSLLIAEFVADVAAEVAEAGPGWPAYDHEINLSLEANRNTYNLAQTIANGGDVPNDERVTNRKSQLLWRMSTPQAFFKEDAMDDQACQLMYLDYANYLTIYEQATDSSLSNDQISHITVRQRKQFDGLELYTWPVLNDSLGKIKVFFHTPEKELDPVDDQNEVILAPNRPILLGAYNLAVVERGEEQGEPGTLIEERYQMALVSAMEDATLQRGRDGAFDWYVD